MLVELRLFFQFPEAHVEWKKRIKKRQKETQENEVLKHSGWYWAEKSYLNCDAKNGQKLEMCILGAKIQIKNETF